MKNYALGELKRIEAPLSLIPSMINLHEMPSMRNQDEVDITKDDQDIKSP